MLRVEHCCTLFSTENPFEISFDAPSPSSIQTQPVLLLHLHDDVKRSTRIPGLATLLVYTRSNAYAYVATIPYQLAEVYGLGILKSVTSKRTVVLGRNDNIVLTTSLL
jgi:hypothetical protein